MASDQTTRNIGYIGAEVSPEFKAAVRELAYRRRTTESDVIRTAVAAVVEESDVDIGDAGEVEV